MNRAVNDKNSIYEEWSKAGIGNAFLFGKVMTTRTDLLLELLQVSLPELHIRELKEVSKEVEFHFSMDAKGVRLDVTARDDEGRLINVEMQLRDEKNIPKRMRYYGGSMDQTLLEPGDNYNELNEVIILFIAPFDPFGRGFYRYIFDYYCRDDRELALNDGMTKILLNAAGTCGDISPDLKGFLELVAGSETVQAGSFAERVQEEVRLARHNAKWRKEYMDWEMTLRNEHYKGFQEGKLEGKLEGKAEGLAEGKSAGVLTERISVLLHQRQKGQDLETVAEFLGHDPEELRPLWDAIAAAAPEYSVEGILKALNS